MRENDEPLPGVTQVISERLNYTHSELFKPEWYELFSWALSDKYGAVLVE